MKTPLAGDAASILTADDAYRRFRRGNAIVISLPGTHSLRVSGTDRIDFVHGQVSSEVRGLSEGGTSEGLLLNHKGQALAQLRVVRRAEDLYLAVEAGAGAFVRERFEQHIIFDQVEIADLTGRLATLSVQGDGASVQAALGALAVASPEPRSEPAPDLVPAPGATLSLPYDDASILITPSRRSGGVGADVHVLARHLEAVEAALVAGGAARASPDVLPLMRVVAGIPHAAHEGGEGVLPQEAGLDPLVSYRKGCYLGQEIMARIEARGAVRRGLVGVTLAGEPRDWEVVANERAVGRLGTVVRHPELGWVGLAVVRNDLDPDVAIIAGGVAAELRALPFADVPD